MVNLGMTGWNTAKTECWEHFVAVIRFKDLANLIYSGCILTLLTNECMEGACNSRITIRGRKVDGNSKGDLAPSPQILNETRHLKHLEVLKLDLSLTVAGALLHRIDSVLY